MTDLLLPFEAISDFVFTMNTGFGNEEDMRPLTLYNHLIQKTTIAHTTVVQKHIDLFRAFCKKNLTAILAMDVEQFSPESVIAYSERVFIEVGLILRKAKSTEQDLLWRHLLTVTALLVPESDAKLKLETLGDIQHDSFTNPLQAFMGPEMSENIMGFFKGGNMTELMSAFSDGGGNGSDGEFDISNVLDKAMGMVEKMTNSKLDKSKIRSSLDGVVDSIKSTIEEVTVEADIPKIKKLSVTDNDDPLESKMQVLSLENDKEGHVLEKADMEKET